MKKTSLAFKKRDKILIVINVAFNRKKIIQIFVNYLRFVYVWCGLKIKKNYLLSLQMSFYSGFRSLR